MSKHVKFGESVGVVSVYQTAYLPWQEMGCVDAQNCRNAKLMPSIIASIVPIRQGRTPIWLSHPFGFDLGTFRPCYGATQMVTHGSGTFSIFF
jgi:hypothetical protein